jgi:hypothetical protein
VESAWPSFQSKTNVPVRNDFIVRLWNGAERCFLPLAAGYQAQYAVFAGEISAGGVGGSRGLIVGTGFAIS